MDSYQHLIDAHNTREAAALKRKNEDQQRYENAAQRAHQVRNTVRFLLPNSKLTQWEDFTLSSQRHLIADAENVALNPSISATELARLYRERLIAWGDSDNPDLLGEDENIEGIVLEHLTACLAEFTPGPDSRLPP